MVRRSPRTLLRILRPWLKQRAELGPVPVRHTAANDAMRTARNPLANKVSAKLAKQAGFAIAGREHRDLFRAMKKHLCARGGYTAEELLDAVRARIES